MGTRHLICVVKDGEFKVAQYGQWDGYFSGQGQDILNFLRDDSFNLAHFKEQLDKCYYIDQDTYVRLLEEGGVVISEDGFVPYDDMKRFSATHLGAFFSRDTGADILKLINDENTLTQIPLKNGVTFAADSLFCEYAYVIDVDKEVLEVYTGFNNDKEHFTERFEFLRGNLKERDEYGLVKLYETYDLNALPEQITPEPNEDDEDDDDE
jgi:FAD/FMN-containing dehydrogenase